MRLGATLTIKIAEAGSTILPVWIDDGYSKHTTGYTILIVSTLMTFLLRVAQQFRFKFCQHAV